RVRACLAEFLVRPETPPDALLVRLQSDAHPLVRAAALTPELVSVLVREPARETSWHVLARAARLMRVPLCNLEPERPWPPDVCPSPAPAGLQPRQPDPPNARPLGPGKVMVAPVGISGHYGLPVEGFVRTAEAGVNLMFWEPTYQTMTEFVTRLSADG